MKLSLLFIAILGVATVSAVPTGKVLDRSIRSLSDDWADFYALIDSDAILEIVHRYAAEDCLFGILLDHLQTDFFRAVIFDLEAIPEFIKFLDYLEAGGLNVYHWWGRFRIWLGIDEKLATRDLSCLQNEDLGPGLVGLWNECMAVLPLAELRALFEEKYENSPDFAHFIALLSSDDAKVIYDVLEDHPVWLEIVGDFNDAGLDVDGFFVWLKDLIRWS